jgi:hypothetical protein
MLDRFVECLMDMRKFWDPLCADLIISGSFYFIHGCLFESRKDISTMKLHGPSILWPDWVRSMTGVSSAYALFIFPKSVCSDISKFLQTIPELDSWTRYVNDILSYVSSFIISIHSLIASPGSTKRKRRERRVHIPIFVQRVEGKRTPSMCFRTWYQKPPILIIGRAQFSQQILHSTSTSEHISKDICE